MSPLAVGLVLGAALVHAGWNLLVKRAGDPSAFLFLATAAAALLGLPLVAWGVAAGRVTLPGLAVAAVSAAVHALYFTLLAAGYRRGHLSVVYPIARGSSPLLVAVLAGPLVGEPLTPLGAGGVAAIVAGIFVIAGGGLPGKAQHGDAAAGGVLFGLLVGATSATYSLVDRAGVALVPPPVYLVLQTLGAAALMAPGWLRTDAVRRRLAATAAPWPGLAQVVLVGAGILVAYGLVLTALTLAPVAYVVAGREVAIVFGTVLGAVVLRERVTPLKGLGAALVLAGITLLAAG